MSLSNPLDLPLITDAQSSKHVTHNDGILKVSQALGNRLAVDVTAGNEVVVADTAQRNYFIEISGAASSGRQVQLPAKNRTLLVTAVAANAHNVTLTIAGGSDTVTMPPNTAALVVTTEANTVKGFFLAQVAVVSEFSDLSDVPGSYASAGGKLVAVTMAEDGLEFIDAPTGGGGGVTEIVDLDDVVVTDAATGDVLLWDEDAEAFLNVSIGSLGGATELGLLTDVDLTGVADGDILVWDDGDELWKPQAPTAPSIPPLDVSIKSTDYTLTTADTNASIYLDDCDLIVPLNATAAIPVGTSVLVTQWGSSASEIIATGGVTINTAETLEFAKRYASGSLVKVATDTWHFAGYTTEL
jgi:hypothetical protein